MHALETQLIKPMKTSLNINIIHDHDLEINTTYTQSACTKWRMDVSIAQTGVAASAPKNVTCQQSSI